MELMDSLLNILSIIDIIIIITVKIKKFCKIVMNFKIILIEVKILMIFLKKNQMMLKSINRSYNKKFRRQNNKTCNNYINYFFQFT